MVQKLFGGRAPEVDKIWLEFLNVLDVVELHHLQHHIDIGCRNTTCLTPIEASGKSKDDAHETVSFLF